jgi:hypothetical protein
LEKQVWLVKSLGHILGPYTTEELEQALRSQKVTLIDEVKKPKSRWKFIRETPELLPIVEEIRNNILQKKEATNTEEIHELTKTDIEITHIGSAHDDLTPTPEMPKSASKVSNSPTVEPKKYVFDVGYSEVASSSTSWKSKSNAPLLWMVVVVALSGLGWWFYSGIQSAKLAPAMSGFAQGLKFYSEGLDEKAAEAFLTENLKTLKPQQQLTALKTLLAFPIHSFAAQELLASLPTESLDVNAADEVYLMRASVSIEAQLWDQVQQSLARIKAAEEWKKVVQTAFQVFSEQLSEADILKKMTETSDSSAVGFVDQYQSFLVGLSAFRKLDLIKHAEPLNSYYTHLVKWSERSTYFRVEFLILKAAFERKLEKNLESTTTMEALINEDPESHRKLRVEVRLPHYAFQKKIIQELCDYLLSENSQGAVARGFRSFCYLKQDDFLNAQKEIESARKLFPAELSIMPLEGFILLRSGQLIEASFREARLDQYPSPLMASLKAEICFRNFSRDCANKILSELNLPWLTDLQTEIKIRTYQKMSLIPQAQRELESALSRNPYYLPYYQIRASFVEGP